MVELIEIETLKKVVNEAVADAISKHQPKTDEDPKYLSHEVNLQTNFGLHWSRFGTGKKRVC
jgi:hypothetical protein